MRATSETLAPGSSDAATSRSFSSRDHRRRRSTAAITSTREIVIALLLGLPLGPAAIASVKQGGLQWRHTIEACVDHISSLERCHNDDGEMEWSILVLNTCEHLRQKPRCCTGSPWLAL